MKSHEVDRDVRHQIDEQNDHEDVTGAEAEHGYAQRDDSPENVDAVQTRLHLQAQTDRRLLASQRQFHQIVDQDLGEQRDGSVDAGGQRRVSEPAHRVVRSVQAVRGDVANQARESAAEDDRQKAEQRLRQNVLRMDVGRRLGERKERNGDGENHNSEVHDDSNFLRVVNEEEAEIVEVNRRGGF